MITGILIGIPIGIALTVLGVYLWIRYDFDGMDIDYYE